MSHENSKTINAIDLGLNEPNRFYNVYGPGPREGQLLPIQYDWERSYYPSMEAAVAAARARSAADYRAAIRGTKVVGPLVAAAVLAIAVLMEVKPG